MWGNLLRFRSKARRVIYTCMFGYSELFNDFSYEPDDTIDFICFTDDPGLKSEFWRMKFVPPDALDPARTAKQIKHLPHRFLHDYEHSLYIDNTVRLKRQPREIFKLLPAPSSFACFRHPWRDCIYDEAAEIIRLSYDDPAIVTAQVNSYRERGYPAKHGLIRGNLLLRRHDNPLLNRVMEAWDEQVLHHSLRDQLSLNFVAWEKNFEIDYIDGNFNDFAEPGIIREKRRVPRDFRDDVYLELNPDVKINPRKHYLHHGAAEGRRYK